MSSYVRRSLGPDFTSMNCPACGDASLHGLIDKNGRPYVSCENCRMRCLGMSLRAVASLRFFGRLLDNETVRSKWSSECRGAVASASAPPSLGVPVPKTAQPVEHADEEARRG